MISPPTLQPGYQCHPCHFLAENLFVAVAPWANGLITVGVQKPPAQAIAMTSADGKHWDAVPGLQGADGTSANAVVSLGHRTVVVGSEHSGSTAWLFDGSSWQQAPEQAALEVPYVAGAMTSVTTFQGAFVAAGYADDPLHNAAAAAVWRSIDGLTWTRDSADAFAGGRIHAMAARGDTIVAVDTNGDPIYGPAGAWRWTQASGWQRATIDPNAGGAMDAVAYGPAGFVAVGKNATDLGASVWTSADGLTWTAVPDQLALHYYQLATRMQSIVAMPTGGFLVGGWRSDVGKGSSLIWTSADGVTWSDPTWETSFSGGEVDGVGIVGDNAVAVGRTGYPDWNQATAWFRPLPL